MPPNGAVTKGHPEGSCPRLLLSLSVAAHWLTFEPVVTVGSFSPILAWAMEWDWSLPAFPATYVCVLRK